MAALKYWVWFTTLPGLTNRSKLLLLEHFPSPEDIYYAQPEDLPPVEGLSSSQAALLSDTLRQGGYLPADHAGRPLSGPPAEHL